MVLLLPLTKISVVLLNSHLSNPLPVVSDVPQGSILGPLLFLIYINDLPTHVVSSNLLLFADDSQCLKRISHSSYCLLLQNDLDALHAWTITCKISFNIGKCSYMRFGSNNTSYQYSINGSPLSSASQVKDLGVLISNDLSFSPHLQLILSRAYKSLGLI